MLGEAEGVTCSQPRGLGRFYGPRSKLGCLNVGCGECAVPVHEKDFGKGPSALGKQSEAMDGLEQLSESCLT